MNTHTNWDLTQWLVRLTSFCVALPRSATSFLTASTAMVRPACLPSEGGEQLHAGKDRADAPLEEIPTKCPQSFGRPPWFALGVSRPYRDSDAHWSRHGGIL